MLNRDIFFKDPGTRKLANDGVARVSDSSDAAAQEVLRYELETFVCEGQYAEGLVKILRSFLENVDKPSQPAAWVSGFFGSGKSHLVKMLKALWINYQFSNGATARDTANLPQEVRELLLELDTTAKRCGGLHAVSGTLGSGAEGSVRMTVIGIIFNSVGLPSQYRPAQFALWLRDQHIYDEVRAAVEEDGGEWENEVRNYALSVPIRKALARLLPQLFPAGTDIKDTLKKNFSEYKSDLTTEEMVSDIKRALDKNGKFPLTLIVLDEVQQFIGESSERSIQVQEVVEACSKAFDGKVLLVGTGQTAITGTSNLKKLEGRFLTRVELSDNDVEGVIRKVILQKKSSAIQAVQDTIEQNIGEISRHLANTDIGHRQEDGKDFVMDYPLLPVRRRFWEKTLRSLDLTGTDSQLRNQLRLVFDAVRANMQEELGSVIPADFIYFESSNRLLQAGVLPNHINLEITRLAASADGDKKLLGRACALIFLINKLPEDLGIRANVDTLSDLLIAKLSDGSSHLRSKLPQLLDDCGILMKIDDEYRIQTKESLDWTNDYKSQYASLSNSPHPVDADRNTRFKKKFASIVDKISIVQGAAKVPRSIQPCYDQDLPANAQSQLTLWVRDGWSTTASSFRAEARKEGNASPVVFVFVPKRSADDLRHALITFRAAHNTLEKRGSPATPDGQEARKAMESKRYQAEKSTLSLLEDIFANVQVMQAGGNEMQGGKPEEMIREACTNSLERLYPNFAESDHAKWGSVYEKARRGAADALEETDFKDAADKHPVCKRILSFIGAGKTGAEIRSHFEAAPYGWSRDTVDGALLALLVPEIIQAKNDLGKALSPKEIERKALGKAQFKLESVTLSTTQRLKLRKLFRMLVPMQNDQAPDAAAQFLKALRALAATAGGEAPKPATPSLQGIDALENLTGNAQLKAIFDQYDELAETIAAWKKTAAAIQARLPEWQTLQRLAGHAKDLPSTAATLQEIDVVRDQRQLILEPDPLPPLTSTLVDALRSELNVLKDRYEQKYDQGIEDLREDENWQKLSPDQKNGLLSEQGLTLSAKPQIAVQSVDDILVTLAATSIPILQERIVALPARFEEVRNEAAILCQPQTQFVPLPHKVLHSEQEIDQWLAEVRAKLVQALSKGPVRPR